MAKVIYIIISTVIVLVLFQTCADNSVQSLEKQDSEDILQPSIVKETEEVKLPEEPVVDPVVQEETVFEPVKLTPTPELIELKEGEFVLRTPAPSLSEIDEGHAEARIVSLEDSGDIKRAGTSSMVLVNEGCFRMGNTLEDPFEDETPVHNVCLKSFYLDSKEVTQEEFLEVMGQNPSRFEGMGLPVDSVSWHEAYKYCKLAGKRLPTEAQWEYAARSEGLDNWWAGASDIIKLSSFAWLKTSSNDRTHNPGSLKPNALGLYDMSGNLREWVNDWFHKAYYSVSDTNDPQGPDAGSDKILRGGAWDDLPRYLRVSYRVRLSPDFKNSRNGFRCALDNKDAVN
jgi:formylglycine-generating enzyme required for sulfatase activity